jgi:hypothetical protein
LDFARSRSGHFFARTEQNPHGGVALVLLFDAR